MALCSRPAAGVVSAVCGRRDHIRSRVPSSFPQQNNEKDGWSLVAESRVQKTELLFAKRRAHASPNCRMSLSASAEPPLCVMSPKAIFGCSPSIFDRKPRSKVEIPLLRDCRRHCAFCFFIFSFGRHKPTTKCDYLQVVYLGFFCKCFHIYQHSTQEKSLD